MGRHLLDDLKNDHRIFAIARRSQHDCGTPVHPNIAWMRVDIADRDGLARTFREIRTAGGARVLVHLAAYYDFTGEGHPEYQRTNVDGTRNVLETTPPDGAHVYAWSRRAGERLVREFSPSLPSRIARFGAIYSDWCEYPPLYVFLRTWLSSIWRSRILAGRREMAIPCIHIRDLVAFFRRLLSFPCAAGPRADPSSRLRAVRPDIWWELDRARAGRGRRLDNTDMAQILPSDFGLTEGAIEEIRACDERQAKLFVRLLLGGCGALWLVLTALIYTHSARRAPLLGLVMAPLLGGLGAVIGGFPIAILGAIVSWLAYPKHPQAGALERYEAATAGIRVCDVCRLALGDSTPKEGVIYCGRCGAWICPDCRRRYDLRAIAALKRGRDGAATGHSARD